MNSCKVQIVRENGSLRIRINEKSYVPLSFKSFRPNPQNVSEFYHAGVRLFSILSSGIVCALGVPYSLYGESWVGHNKYDFSVIDKQIEMFIANAPDAYFAVMLQLDTREWYLQENPDTPNSFTHLSQAACDAKWRTEAAEYLKNAIRHIENTYGDKVYAYFLLGGTTTEWFSDFDYEKPNTMKNESFKRWIGDKNANLPEEKRLNKSGKVFLDEQEEDVYLARRFHNELIADLILYFAAAAQSVLNHTKLVGLYYGYLLELAAPRLYNAGSLGYEKVFLSPDIDIISSPSSYGYRGIRDPSAFMVTQKTLDLHNKLYFLEFDHITYVAPSVISDGVDDKLDNKRLTAIPGAETRCKDLTETLNLMYRDFILCQANGAALWWFDMFDGWFRSEEMMDSIGRMIHIAEELSRYDQHSVAEIAVFAEGEAMYRARKSENLAGVCLSNIRRTLAGCGAPYDLYSISDILQKETEKYKLFIFVNQYDIPDEIISEIKSKCEKDGKTILWLYAPNYAGDGKCNVCHIGNITGMHIDESDRSHGGIVYEDSIVRFPLSAPYFSVNDPESKPIAYFEDGSVAVAEKDFGKYSSIYSAACNIPSELLRSIAQAHDIPIYSHNSGVYTYVNSGMIGAYNATDDDAQLNLPDDGAYIDHISGESFVCENGVLTLPKRPINAFLLTRRESSAVAGSNAVTQEHPAP